MPSVTQKVRGKFAITTHHSQTGFSLPELMIAMVLGLIVILAVINFFAPLKATVTESKRLEHAADALRYATLTLSKSIKQATGVSAISLDQLALSATASAAQPRMSCLGNSKSADYVETFSFAAPNLSCNDGSGAQVLLTGLESAHFTQTGELISITLKPIDLPSQYGSGIKITVSLRKPLWQQAVSAQRVQ